MAYETLRMIQFVQFAQFNKNCGGISVLQDFTHSPSFANTNSVPQSIYVPEEVSKLDLLTYSLP
jgi:hypothetical protein